jgi:Rieske Fe-S protein
MLKLIIFAFLTCCLLACSSSGSDDPVPRVSFPPIFINLNLPEYIALRSNGGYKSISGGVRGIIIYRESSTTYYAFERNCTFHPNEACATVEVHSSGLYMTDTCCGSIFDFKGNPTGGPAVRPLLRYAVTSNGNSLTITDDVVQ